jgi:hypothetical protein
MNCSIVVKKIKELLKSDITQIPDYVAEIIKENPNQDYITLCEYIVDKHNSLIKDIDDGLKNYIKERQNLHDLISGMLDSSVVSFTTALNMIYYLNKDIKTIQINNTRLMALLDSLKNIDKNKKEK